MPSASRTSQSNDSSPPSQSNGSETRRSLSDRIRSAEPLRKHHINLDIRGTAVEFDLCQNPCWPDDGQLAYEPEISNTMVRFVRPGDCVVDCGANLGWFTSILARLVGDDGLVMAFEPDPNNFEELQFNIALNRFPHVYLGQTALWSHDARLSFWLQEHSGYSSFIHYDNAVEGIPVLARSLDSLLNTPTVPQPRLIKIDCEGSEKQILLGARRVLERGVDAVIVEFNFNIFSRHGISESDIRNYMHGLGYSFFLINGTGIDKPMLLDPAFKLVGKGNCIFNGLFSTQDKVDQAWTSE